MTLTDWLLAQIAEDEAAARAAEPGPWHVVSQYGDASLRYGDPDARGLGIAHASWDYDDERSPADFAHMARWDPARVLAGCERDRRIVELHRSWDSRRHLDYCDTCAVWDEAGYEGARGRVALPDAAPARPALRRPARLRREVAAVIEVRALSGQVVARYAEPCEHPRAG